MKIGILTLPQETNYGGILQNYALQQILLQMGHEPITIDRHNKKGFKSVYIQTASFIKRLILRYLLNRNVTTLWSPFITEEEYAIISSKTQEFINNNIKLTRRIYSTDLEIIDKEYLFDGYVVGSDQVWLDKYCPNSFLDFVKRKDVKKVVFSASCGEKSFLRNSNKLQICKRLAKDFAGISVREYQLVDECRSLLGLDVQWLLDPTMLLNRDDYFKFVKTQDNDSILFSYILDNNSWKKQIVEKVSKDLSLKIINGNVHRYYKRNTDAHIDECIFPSVEDWLTNIFYSDFVVTDSFHGTVFAILFNKQFLTIANKRRGLNRFTSLLKMFQLENRLIYDHELINDINIMARPIDYLQINKILKDKVSDSLCFLRKALS